MIMSLKLLFELLEAFFARIAAPNVPKRIYINYNHCRRIALLLLGVLFSLLFVSYSFISFENVYSSVKSYLHERNVWDLISEPDCWPIKSDATQYSVVIDGHRYPKFVPLHKNSSIDFKCLNRRRVTKKMLAWTSYFNDRGMVYGLDSNQGFKDRKCPVDKCILFDDKERKDEADLVLVHMRDYVTPIPQNRKPSTRLLFMLYESPMHSGQMETYNNVFNLTSTYKLDSDFPGLYEGQSDMIWKLNETFDESFDFSQGRTRMAAMVVSNCQPSNKRMEYVKVIQKYIDVDVFGYCGAPCPIDDRGDCKEIIGDHYKFYFAFENSNCDGYVTEKFFTILKYNVIPVVYGGGNYEDYIPKSGFINAFDFKGPKELADYLTYLGKNSTAYNSYFKWKKHVSFGVGTYVDFTTICDMCIHLLLEDYVGLTKKTIADMGSYWSREKNCNKVPEYDFESSQ